MRRARVLLFVILAAVAVPLLAAGLGAQESPGLDTAGRMAGQSLRPYAHVFISYAIAILAVTGWVISIGRRLGRVERQLRD